MNNELEAIRRLISELSPILDIYEKYTYLDMNPDTWTDETIVWVISRCLNAPAARALLKLVTEHMPEVKNDEI